MDWRRRVLKAFAMSRETLAPHGDCQIESGQDCPICNFLREAVNHLCTGASKENPPQPPGVTCLGNKYALAMCLRLKMQTVYGPQYTTADPATQQQKTRESLNTILNKYAMYLSGNTDPAQVGATPWVKHMVDDDTVSSLAEAGAEIRQDMHRMQREQAQMFEQQNQSSRAQQAKMDELTRMMQQQQAMHQQLFQQLQQQMARQQQAMQGHMDQMRAQHAAPDPTTAGMPREPLRAQAPPPAFYATPLPMNSRPQQHQAPDLSDTSSESTDSSDFSSEQEWADDHSAIFQEARFLLDPEKWDRLTPQQSGELVGYLRRNFLEGRTRRNDEFTNHTMETVIQVLGDLSLLVQRDKVKARHIAFPAAASSHVSSCIVSASEEPTRACSAQWHNVWNLASIQIGSRGCTCKPTPWPRLPRAPTAVMTRRGEAADTASRITGTSGIGATRKTASRTPRQRTTSPRSPRERRARRIFDGSRTRP
jgi:hypothetical protein